MRQQRIIQKAFSITIFRCTLGMFPAEIADDWFQLTNFLDLWPDEMSVLVTCLEIYFRT